MEKLSSTVFALIAIFLTMSIQAQEFNYIGVKKCSMCHKSEKQGTQFTKWQNGPHSKAYRALATEEADKIAKEAGFDTPAAKTEACLKCHVTGYDLAAERLEEGFNIEDGVQCETCHGPGSEYRSITVMKDRAKAVELGLNIWDSDEAIANMCRGCHNEESPTFAGFNFEEMYPKIKHNIPSE